jgi:hypothetical protein
MFKYQEKYFGGSDAWSAVPMLWNKSGTSLTAFYPSEARDAPAVK